MMLLAVAQQEDEVPSVRREAIAALVTLLEDDKRKEEVRPSHMRPTGNLLQCGWTQILPQVQSRRRDGCACPDELLKPDRSDQPMTRMRSCGSLSCRPLPLPSRCCQLSLS